MKNLPILPHKFKKIGWFILPFTLALGIACTHFEVEFKFLKFDKPGKGIMGSDSYQNFTNEIALTLFLINLLFISFSKEKQEDEFVNHLRLTSFQWAVLFNTGIILIASWLVYDFAYIHVMMYGMFSTLVFYIFRFNILHYRIKHDQSN